MMNAFFIQPNIILKNRTAKFHAIRWAPFTRRGVIPKSTLALHATGNTAHPEPREHALSNYLPIRKADTYPVR